MPANTEIKILQASTQEHYNQIKNLINEFLQWHLSRHSEDIELIKEYFDPSAFEKELNSLPGKYAKPDGSLLLALFDGEAAGCVALRKIDSQSCEMKRLFVSDQFKGKKVGVALAKAIIEEAREMGYASMKLDTSFRQVEAISLYQGLGFKRIEAYYPVSKSQNDWLVFMELTL
ncbi:MAG: GNAT family N-acetyltransferase [Cyclobacteriaceae bacterium]